MTTMLCTINTAKTLDRWFNKIRGYDRLDPAGTDYYDVDGNPYYINGHELVEAVLDQMSPYVVQAQGDPTDTQVAVNLEALLDYLVSTESRSPDYSVEDLEADLEDENTTLGILTGVMRELEIHVNPGHYVREDSGASAETDDPETDDLPPEVRRHSHVTTGAPAPRKESTMIQRTPKNRTNAAVARAQARTAMKLRMENQRTAAVNRLRRRLAAVRAARAERVAAVQPEAQPRRPSRILRSAADRPVARRDHEVTTKSVARDEVRRRIAAIRQKAAAARQAAGQEIQNAKPADRFAALRERLAQRRRIAAIRATIQERRASVEHDAEVAPPAIRVKGVRYERID